MQLNPNTVLVLAPHTDDGELGAGGLLSSLSKKNAQIIYVAFSAAEESIPAGFSSDATRKEVLAATSKLGIEPDSVFVLDYKVRYLHERRQDILDELIRLRKKYAPDLVLLPNTDDVHQDHQVVSQEGIRAFKNTNMLGYELIWNQFNFPSQLIYALDSEDVQRKLEALQCYETQEGRPYMDESFVFGLAKARGVQVGVDYAEAFEVIRCVIK